MRYHLFTSPLYSENMFKGIIILLIKSTAAKNEVALSHHRVNRLFFLAVIFVRGIIGKMQFVSFFAGLHCGQRSI